MAGWPDGRTAGWPDGGVGDYLDVCPGWPVAAGGRVGAGGRMVGWPDGRMAGWPVAV